VIKVTITNEEGEVLDQLKILLQGQENNFELAREVTATLEMEFETEEV